MARARIDIEMTRLLCLKAADMMDKVGNKSAAAEIAMIKVQAPNMALKIIDDAIQAHGGAGVSEDFGLAQAYAAPADPAACRRSRRSAQPRDRPHRIRQAQRSERAGLLVGRHRGVAIKQQPVLAELVETPSFFIR